MAIATESSPRSDTGRDNPVTDPAHSPHWLAAGGSDVEISQQRERGRRFKRRRRISKAFSRLRDRREGVTAGKLRGFYRDLRREVVGNLGRVETLRADLSLFDRRAFRNSFNRVMMPQWRLTLWTGAKFELDWIEQAGLSKQSAAILEAMGSGDVGSVARARVIIVTQDEEVIAAPPPSVRVELPNDRAKQIRAYLSDRQKKVWKFASDTAQTQVRRLLDRALREGWTLRETTRAINSKMIQLERWQAQRISRTESTSSMNFGQNEARLAAGIDKKEWTARIDNRTRRAANGSQFDHIQPDGQIVGVKARFRLTGLSGVEYLHHPGDSSQGASAGNVINCRCTAVAAID